MCYRVGIDMYISMRVRIRGTDPTMFADTSLIIKLPAVTMFVVQQSFNNRLSKNKLSQLKQTLSITVFFNKATLLFLYSKLFSQF